MEIPVICPTCSHTTPAGSFFCSNCGKPLQKVPLSTTAIRQIGIYFISFSLPPTGLWYGYKYLKEKDTKSKIIGWAAIAITIISLVITVWLTEQVLSSVNKTIGTQLNVYQQLGY